MPMCRTFMSGLRSLCSSTSGPPAATSGPLTQWPIKLKQLIFTSTVRRLLLSLIDQQQRFHIICAYTIVLAAGCHSISHIVNAYNFSQNYNPQYPELNLAQYHGQDPLKLILFTMPGITGLMMVAIILILLVTATESVRSRHYDIFWYAHRLIIVFVVLLVIHPMGGLLKEQINTDKHWPSLCHTLSMNTSTASAVRYDIPSNVTPSAGESMLIYSQMPGDMVTLNYANESTDVTDTSGNATSEIVTEPNDVDSVTTGYDEDMGQPVTATLSSLYANASQGRSLNDAFSHDETGETDKICQERPRFASLESGTWKWLAAALTIYGIDLSLRLARRRRSSVVLDAKVYEQSSVLEVQLGASLKSTVNEAKPAGRTFLQPGHPRPGSFVFIKCPQISLIEWHPFSLAAVGLL
ncbi:NADPH oxidase 4 [Halotydeus destructor]|nr:NADPH oxidase 4 [Halotydeus destructor]